VWDCISVKKILKNIKFRARIAHLEAKLAAAESRANWAFDHAGKVTEENGKLREAIKAYKSAYNGRGAGKGGG
jgi:hypothetical protein